MLCLHSVKTQPCSLRALINLFHKLESTWGWLLGKRCARAPFLVVLLIWTTQAETTSTFPEHVLHFKLRKIMQQYHCWQVVSGPVFQRKHHTVKKSQEACSHKPATRPYGKVPWILRVNGNPLAQQSNKKNMGSGKVKQVLRCNKM